MPERTCAWLPCGAAFTPKRCDQRTCSADCRKRHNNAEQNAKRYVVYEPRVCVACPTVFTPTRSDSVTCSARCRDKRHYRHTPKRYERLCECGKVFTATRSDKARCSARCNSIANYDANRASRIASATTWNKTNTEARSSITRQYKHARRTRELGQAPAFVSLRDWQRLVRRYGGRCAYCQQVAEDGELQQDHVVPLSRGGSHGIGNILPACGACNMSKSKKLLIEWRIRQRGSCSWPQMAGTAAMQKL